MDLEFPTAAMTSQSSRASRQVDYRFSMFRAHKQILYAMVSALMVHLHLLHPYWISPTTQASEVQTPFVEACVLWVTRAY